MKFHKLFNNFSPKKKCGAETVLTGVGLGLGFLGGVGETMQADDAVLRNLRENERNRQFNHDEAALQRQWQSSEWDKQFQQQLNAWYKQYDYNQEQSYQYWLKQQHYSSPSEQIKRLNAAGLNANAMFNDGNVGGLAPAASIPSAPSTPNPSVPAASAASIGTPNPAVASSSADMMRSIGSLVSDLSKVYVENTKLRPEIDEIFANIKNKELMNEGIQLDNAFKSMSFGSRVEKAKNEMLASTIQLSILKSTKENIDEDTLLKVQERHEKASEVLLNEMLSDKADMESCLLFKQLISYDKRLESELSTQASERSRNYAAASESSANARLRNLESDIQDYSNKIERGEIDWNNETMRIKYDKMIRDLAKGLNADDKEIAQIERYLETMHNLRGNRFLRGLDNLADYMSVKFGVNILGVPGLGSGSRSVVKGFRP